MLKSLLASMIRQVTIDPKSFATSYAHISGIPTVVADAFPYLEAKKQTGSYLVHRLHISQLCREGRGLQAYSISDGNFVVNGRTILKWMLNGLRLRTGCSWLKGSVQL